MTPVWILIALLSVEVHADTFVQDSWSNAGRRWVYDNFGTASKVSLNAHGLCPDEDSNTKLCAGYWARLSARVQERVALAAEAAVLSQLPGKQLSWRIDDHIGTTLEVSLNCHGSSLASNIK